MRYSEDDKDMIIDHDDARDGAARWLPKLVVLSAVGGFLALAWYAYHTGTQSLKDDSLVVVEADTSPMKEKPLDPGGMKFPNQDKTIFDTFANNPQNPPNVERVLPAPEEPMPKEMDDSQTQTWINDKLHPKGDNADGKPEQVIGEEKKESEPPVPPKGSREMAAATIDKALSEDVSHSEAAFQAPKPVKQQVAEMLAPPRPGTSPSKESSQGAKGPKIIKVESEEPAQVKEAAAKPAETVAKEVPASEKPKDTAPHASGGTVKAQLGAYRSESEAKTAFAKMQQKFPQLAGKSPIVVKADLGAKGIFYRLRVGGIAADEVKSFCSGLSAKGQACIAAKD